MTDTSKKNNSKGLGQAMPMTIKVGDKVVGSSLETNKKDLKGDK